jgi:hypothetical protein
MYGNFRARLAGQTINGLTIISLKKKQCSYHFFKILALIKPRICLIAVTGKIKTLQRASIFYNTQFNCINKLFYRILTIIISLKIIYLTVIGSTFSEKEMLNEWKKHYTEKFIH